MQTIDYTSPDLWDDLQEQTADLVASYQSAYEQVGEPGPDAAWKSVMLDLLSAALDTFDPDKEAAAGALTEGLDAAVAELSAPRATA